MGSKTEQKVEELRANITAKSADEIISLDRLNYRLSDAIREGSSVTDKVEGWGSGDTACALHAGLIAAKARGYAD